ncbi:hypothetical protein V5N11_021257 [Cardamine amara subsp. amara]|uniref:Uncharacterized protein n=1 Tax=Cardamine amara subsp. amara TaxID=228776 RepID=A0ABD1B146_CARAN
MDFFCSFIYASNFAVDRVQLWEDIRFHHSSPLIRGKPWMIMGNFNEFLTLDEHSGFPGSMERGTRVSHCSLTDLAYHGPKYTWTNKQGDSPISKKLDRVLISDSWLQVFPNSYSVYEAGGCGIYLTAPS